jgi:LuxR family maltose regulon positive regulatory protein
VPAVPEFAQAGASVERHALVSDKTMAEFQVFAFGEPKVLIAGKPIMRWRTARALELFFLLLDANRPVHKEQIMTMLWSETDDHTEQNMRATVFHLRKVIGDQGIIYRAGTYALHLAALHGEEIWYDVATFQRYAATAKEILADDPVAARELFQKMVSLYKGDYAQSFYSDWCRQRRQELRDLYLEAHQNIALFCWHNSQLDECLEHWQSIVLLDDCLEDAHTGIIRCYLRQGKRGQALRQYQRCVNILQEELGMGPGPILQKLARHLT